MSSQKYIPPTTVVPNNIRLRNSLFATGIVTFCGAVAYYAFSSMRRDRLWEDPYTYEIIEEIKREELIQLQRKLQ